MRAARDAHMNWRDAQSADHDGHDCVQRVMKACEARMQVIEAHPQHEVPDLRVLAPPSELTAFINERWVGFRVRTSARVKEWMGCIPYECRMH